MTSSVIEFCNLGTHGLAEAESGYPWGRWMNGRQWGYCPEVYGGTPRKFKKILKDHAREAKMTVEYFEYELAHENWVLFRFHH